MIWKWGSLYFTFDYNNYLKQRKSINLPILLFSFTTKKFSFSFHTREVIIINSPDSSRLLKAFRKKFIRLLRIMLKLANNTTQITTLMHFAHIFYLNTGNFELIINLKKNCKFNARKLFLKSWTIKKRLPTGYLITSD